jgi:tRNA uridine 5-carboxymethylaminomethyl modification enzyme
MFNDEEQRVVERRFADEDEARHVAERTSVRPEQVDGLLAAAGGSPLPHATRIVELAKRQGISLADLLRAAGAGAELAHEALITAELEIKYAGYFERERAQAEKMMRMGGFALSPDLAYAEMRSLSFEARQKLAAIRPRTLAQASRIPGVSPNDLQNLVLEVEKARRAGASVAD